MPLDDQKERNRAIENAVVQIEKQFGKGSIMRLGQRGAIAPIDFISTGSISIDYALGIGGLPRGRVVEIFGPESSGKTTLALQVARNIAQSGQANALYVCFEHDEEYLLNRLMAMESALAGPMPPDTNRSIRIQDVRREVLGTWLAQGGQDKADLRANPCLLYTSDAADE